MRAVFEHGAADAAGRLGTLRIPRSDHEVATPALMPVINPHLVTVEPGRLADEFGAELLITNAYVLWSSEEYRDRARAVGLRELLGFDGPIMTDSGSFQLAEYGRIDASNEEILTFQREIGSDIVTPVDVPTPPDAGRDRTERDLATTRDRIERASELDLGDALLTAPIQGGTHSDLRQRAAEEASGLGDVYPIGAVVPLLRDYRFADIVEAVVAAKRALPAAAPVHLFGAGHPMMFALAVAMGCDLFDSAAYARYARDDRYLTVRGTRRLADLETFPCACSICAEWTPETVREADHRERLLAEHNLHASFAELRRIRSAIRAGDLMELVESRARAHPTMLDGYRALLEHADWLERHDPVGDGAFFYLSSESASRPAVRRHHDRLARLDPPAELVLSANPAALDSDIECWRLVPPFGPVPPALARTVPLSGELPARTDAAAYEAAVAGIERLLEANPERHLSVDVRDWPPFARALLPSGLDRRETG